MVLTPSLSPHFTIHITLFCLARLSMHTQCQPLKAIHQILLLLESVLRPFLTAHASDQNLSEITAFFYVSFIYLLHTNTLELDLESVHYLLRVGG